MDGNMKTSTLLEKKGYADNNPIISVHKDGGALKGIGGEFSANPVSRAITMWIVKNTSSEQQRVSCQFSLFYNQQCTSVIKDIALTMAI